MIMTTMLVLTCLLLLFSLLPLVLLLLLLLLSLLLSLLLLLLPLIMFLMVFGTIDNSGDVVGVADVGGSRIGDVAADAATHRFCKAVDDQCKVRLTSL